MLYFETILISLFITISLIPVMTKLAARFQMVDIPDPRKVHTVPIPRIGGLAMAVGTFIPVILWAEADDFVKAYLAGAGTLVLFGLIDDLKGLGYKAKFAGQMIAALIAIFFGKVRIESLGTLLPEGMLLPEWVAIPLSLAAVVGVTNAVNLADGLDGLAGGISLLGFCCIGYLAFLAENNAIMIMSLSLAGAIFGFLRFNTHPASLFMGDTGSQLLGYSAVLLAVKLTQGSTPFSQILPLVILGFPVLDTLAVMVERAREGRPLFTADKKHFHHRLMRFGMSHTEAVFTIYVIQALLILSAILLKYHSDWMLMSLYALFCAVVIIAFNAADRTGFRFHRPSAIDHHIAKRFRSIRDKHMVIRTSFALTKLLVPLLLISGCLVPAHVPGYAAVMAVCFGLSLLAVRVLAKDRMSLCLRLVLYLTIPLVLYLVQEGSASWITESMLSLYQLSFGLIALCVVLVAKFTRRKKGFRMTTMDFLVIFIAVIVPNLPDSSIQSHGLGLLAVETIVLLFGHEVLIAELRERIDILTASTSVALALIGIRGGMGL